jgi:hypothetical protein
MSAYMKVNPTVKQAVLRNNKPGNTARIVFSESIGLPTLRNESNNPITPIKAPPTPTKEKPGDVNPSKVNNMGSKKINNPAIE